MANIITFLRIPLAIAMLCVTPFSAPFWCLYFCSGFTDIADGMVARALDQESSFGAKLDSVADAVFAVCIAIFVVLHIAMPVWLWYCILGIALLRLISYGIGFYKYHTFVSLHTCANKLTGVFLFMAPIFHRFCGLTFTSVVLCTVAFFSSVEELMITLKHKELNRDCKSIWIR